MSQYLQVPSTSFGANLDDTTIQALPQSQVDYLSHVWKEEDVWRSWRNMTRQKNAIANGTRLENASWRTWWKQRNKLSTISPETLNWLKDSDVTWLYGPLHSAEVEPVPPPRISTAQERLGLESSTSVPPRTQPAALPRTSTPLKPILKHRSIVEMLTHQMPVSSINDDYIEFGDVAGPGDYFPAQPATGPSPSRPAIPHTKSDTNLFSTSIQTRKTSPTSHPDEHPREGRYRSPSTRSPSASGSPHRTNSDHEAGPSSKRHISFNTFVEQCISIEKPVDQRSDDDASSDDELDESDDDEESDAGVLEFRTRSGSVPLPSGPKKPSLVRHNSHSGEQNRGAHVQHVTIAPIAPTILKSSESFPGVSPAVVFVPPNGSVYTSSTPPAHFQLDEDVPFSSTRSVQRVRGGAASPASSSSYPVKQVDHFDDSDETPDLGFGDQFRSNGGTASPRGRREGPAAARYAAEGGVGGRRHHRSSPSASPEPSSATSSSSKPVDIAVRHHTWGGLSASPDKLSPDPYIPRGRSGSSPNSGSYRLDSSRNASSSSNERSESRGRSGVRGSSSSGLSDKSRSSSRHRVGSTSPIGSISPNPSRSSLAAVVAAANGDSGTPSPSSPRSPPEASASSGAVASGNPAPQQPTLKSAMKQRSVDFVRPSLVINRDQLEAQTGAQSSGGSGGSGGASDMSPAERHDYWADAPGQAPMNLPQRAGQPAVTRSPADHMHAPDDGLVGRAVSSARGMLRGILFNNPPTAAATARE
ncbi:hypothetical protein BKA62DRAFT_832720 [Auriculariales sp. MPI-PUGE-AT-0066]|nr:hypothetical protein BKA62DRAFT_832720 [Auriculariales sp. MPI-PUGE-AT-0066]